jgi:DegV family protein with EDD domain
MGVMEKAIIAAQADHVQKKEKKDAQPIRKIAIVTDSATNLPQVIIDQYGITVVPIYLHWNNHTYRDGVDISTEEVYRRLRETKQIPRTAAPSVGDFLQTYLGLSQKVDAILSIHIPENLSGTVASARLAAELAQEHVEVHVVDTGTAAMGAGFVALAAARANARGEDLEDVMQLVEKISSRATIFAMIDTLEYLYRGGRIGKAQGLLGVALRIKPILTINNQEVDVLAKTRTTSRGIQIMLKEMQKRVGSQPVHVAVLHADALDQAYGLKQLVQEQFEYVEIFTCSITPVMGAHTGPGLLGLAFYAEDDL